MSHFYKRLRWSWPAIIVLHALLCWQLVQSWASSPVLLVEMSSTVESQAQVFYDTGSGIRESESTTVPVQGQGAVQTLHLKLPNAAISLLRFDPLMVPGTVVIRKAVVLQSNGSAAIAFAPGQMKAQAGLDPAEIVPSGVQFRAPPGSADPQIALELKEPLHLESRLPGMDVLLNVLLYNAFLLLIEACLLAIVVPPRRFALLLIPHGLMCWAFFQFWSPSPVLLIEMSSDVFSRAQVYYDAGQGVHEDQSSSAPVRPSSTFHEYRFPLPNSRITYLRFDPITCPGTVFLGRLEVLRSDGTVAHSFPFSKVNGVIGFDEVNVTPLGLRYHIRTDSEDPQFVLEMDGPIDLTSRTPGLPFFLRLGSANAILFALEWLCITFLRRIHDRVKAVSSRWTGSFLQVDPVAAWFYIACVLLFIVFSAANFNGSSMGVFWANFKVGAPSDIVAGKPQEIRADEFNYQTPGMLNQVFRADKLDVQTSAFGNHSTALLSALPVRHFTTLLRPQYWPFFVLPPDLAFATWWQAKWLIFATGVFTFFLLITRSGFLALAGTLWLLFSQFTQWCYTWPSMLPEMAGLFCFTVVCACYLTVGTRIWPLLFGAIACAACAINFALFAYVPHLIPYAWAGVFFLAAWCIAYRNQIARLQGRNMRCIALGSCLLLTGVLLAMIVHDAKDAIAGIANTVYPGHRSLDGGGFSLATFGTHFLAPFESDRRFPPEYSNINESAGFLWFAPVTLLCRASVRALPRERRLLLYGLWTAAILLAAWMLIPIPAWAGSILFLNRVQAIRVVPALGLLNAAIVITVLSAPVQPRRHSLWVKAAVMFAAAYVLLFIANHSVRNYFKLSEVLICAAWAGITAVLLWDRRRIWFAASVVVPSILLFALINPIQRGIETITDSTLFQVVHNDPKLLQGKWLIFPGKFPASVFTAVGCDVFNGSKYLPDIDHFPLYAAHGLNTTILNNLGYVDIEQLDPGQPPTVRRGPYGVVMALSPLDPLIKELGIRYVAFHKRPSEAVLEHFSPLVSGNVSEFWLYEIK